MNLVKMFMLCAVVGYAFSQHAFFAEKARLLINELCRQTEYHLDNLPVIGNVTLMGLNITELKLEPVAIDAEFYRGSLQANVQIEYSGAAIDGQLAFNAVFKCKEELTLKSADFKMLKLGGIYSLVRSTVESYANKFLSRVIEKPIPLDLSIPSYVLFGKGTTQPGSITFDLDKYIEHRKQVTGWTQEASEEDKEVEPTAETQEL